MPLSLVAHVTVPKRRRAAKSAWYSMMCEVSYLLTTLMVSSEEADAGERSMFERPRNVEAAQDEDRALPATCVLQDLRERGAENARDWWTLPRVDWPPARGAAAPRTVLLSAVPSRRQSSVPALSGCATAPLTRCSSVDTLLTVMCLLSEEAVAMSRGLTNANYSHCPLKKRPVYVTDSLDHTTGRLHI